TCTKCKATKTESIAKINHTEKSTTTKATPSVDGKIVKSCSVCKATLSTTVIPKASNISLSSTSIVYNGKVQTPGVTVKDSTGKVLKNGTDYSVNYASGRTGVGRYAVTITFKGNYSGTSTQYFNIVPQTPQFNRITINSTSAFTSVWNRVGVQCHGYQIQFATKSDFSDAKTYTISGNGNVSKQFTGLYKNWKYYIRVRSYYTNGSTYYSAWSATKWPWMTTASGSVPSVVYNGKLQTPTVTVKDSNGKVLKNGSDYTLVYSEKRTYVGRYPVRIYYRGSYGYIPSQTVYFNITPQTPQFNRITINSTSAFTTQWNMVGVQCHGYQIQFATKSDFSDAKTYTISGSGNVSKQFTGMKKNWRYYVRVRTYYHGSFNGSSYNFYSPWSTSKSAWMTTATPQLSVTKQKYNGNVKTPVVTVKDSNGKVLKNGTDYTVTYQSGRKNIGTYYVKVSYKGSYGYLPT
ncbi:MAG: hypothetical protein K2H20_02580, partial [Bacilli bacterium]|nr:hypothetical protein [Bacilli bacterium]